MATTEEVKKLAALARIKISDEELGKFTMEFDSILSYVGQLEKLELQNAINEKPVLRNVMREDVNPSHPKTYTEKVAEQFPSREGDALVVKQIISHDEDE